MKEKESVEKKPFYKKKWFIGIAVFVALGMLSDLIGTDEEEVEAEEPTVEEIVVAEVEEDPVEVEEEPVELSREEEIEQIIRDRVNDGPGYVGFEVDEVKVNNNLGDEDSETYIALVYLSWTTKNKVERADGMIDAAAPDVAANLYNEGAEDVAEIAVFIDDEYNNRSIKYSYEWTERGFSQTDYIAH